MPQVNRDPLRWHREHRAHAASAFGSGGYGRFAEGVSRGMGTPQFVIGQTVFLVGWILLNGLVLHKGAAWDVYPFILLNLMLSFQAGYSGPMIMVASNRQAERDKLKAEADALHREELHEQVVQLVQASNNLSHQNATLIRQNTGLTQTIHQLVAALPEAIAGHVSKELTKSESTTTEEEDKK